MSDEYAQPMSMEEWETFQPYEMWERGRDRPVIRFEVSGFDPRPRAST